MPHDQLAAQIVRQATLGHVAGETPAEVEEFAIVFAAMGVKNDVADYFRKSFTESGALTRVAMFLNLADDPPVERIVTPRAALTLAEYLAYELEKHVLVVLTDMTNYGEALRQISNVRGEVPSRKGYPGYLYSDLASMYERTGRIRTSKGSITQIPILTMPNDDITHPMPDLTGYITEGQIVLSPEVSARGVYPPVDALSSLSRLMRHGAGPGRTREDHLDVAAQTLAALAAARRARELAELVGTAALTPLDQQYLRLEAAFEARLVSQGQAENRGFAETMTRAWQVLAALPRRELAMLPAGLIDAYYPGGGP
jgi:V/A-type H+/Na+-transporting ATPase subunit B